MLLNLVRLARPHQWTKNFLCLAGAVFSGQLFVDNSLQLDIVKSALFTAGAFAAASSSIYVLNDILDRKRDQQHPKKKNRPLASGAVPVGVAVVFGICLASGAFLAAWQLGAEVFYSMALLVVINIAYSLRLKHSAILDVMCIAMGFVLRLLAGIYVVGDVPTTWITLCTFFLATFFGFSKRRAELAYVGTLEKTQDVTQRPVLANYTTGYLDDLLSSAATITIICYALFTVMSGKNPSLIMTLPFVYYGIMRYKHLVTVGGDVEEPERVVFRDYRLVVTFVTWLTTYLLIEHWWDFAVFRSGPFLGGG